MALGGPTVPRYPRVGLDTLARLPRRRLDILRIAGRRATFQGRWPDLGSAPHAAAGADSHVARHIARLRAGWHCVRRNRWRWRLSLRRPWRRLEFLELWPARLTRAQPGDLPHLHG